MPTTRRGRSSKKNCKKPSPGTFLPHLYVPIKIQPLEKSKKAIGLLKEQESYLFVKLSPLPKISEKNCSRKTC